MTDLTKGVVTDDDDPSGGYRVEVSLPTQRRTNVWCDVASFYASAKGGACFLPEKGDEVLVAFLDGDVNQPVIVGSLFTKQSPPPHALHGENKARGIQTSSGAMLRFDDDARRSSAVLSLADSSVAVGSDDVAIVATGDVSVESGQDLHITSGHNLNVEAGHDFGVEAGLDAAIKATRDAAVIAGGTGLIESTQRLVIDGGTDLTMKAVRAELEGTQGVTVKGTQATLAGAATTTISGGIVRIN